MALSQINLTLSRMTLSAAWLTVFSSIPGTAPGDSSASGHTGVTVLECVEAAQDAEQFSPGHCW